MSPSIVTPANLAQHLGMFMDAAEMGMVPAKLAEGKILFNGSGSDPAELPRIIETDPRAGNQDSMAADARLASLVKAGTGRGTRAQFRGILREVRVVQWIADQTVRRKDRKGNFRKEAEASLDLLNEFKGAPAGELDWHAAELFLASAFLYTSLQRPADRIRSKDLFVRSASIFKGQRRHTIRAVLYELAALSIEGISKLRLAQNGLKEEAARAWLDSFGEYDEHDSARFRIFRALVHLSVTGAGDVKQELFEKLSSVDFEDDNFYDFYADNIRQAYVIASDPEVMRYQWRIVMEVLEGAAMVWEMLEETEAMEFDMIEPLMRLARAAEAFLGGATQFIM